VAQLYDTWNGGLTAIQRPPESIDSVNFSSGVCLVLSGIWQQTDSSTSRAVLSAYKKGAILKWSQPMRYIPALCMYTPQRKKPKNQTDAYWQKEPLDNVSCIFVSIGEVYNLKLSFLSFLILLWFYNNFHFRKDPRPVTKNQLPSN
jgi:hypothetical protein